MNTASAVVARWGEQNCASGPRPGFPPSAFGLLSAVGAWYKWSGAGGIPSIVHHGVPLAGGAERPRAAGAEAREALCLGARHQVLAPRSVEGVSGRVDRAFRVLDGVLVLFRFFEDF